MDYIIIAGVGLLLFFAKIIYDHTIYEKTQKNRRKLSFGELTGSRRLTSEMLEEIALLSKRMEDVPGEIDDTTWNDLSMDLIFQKLNQTGSSVGEEVLYDILRHPCMTPENLEKREKTISFIETHEEERLSIRKIYEEMGKIPNSSFYGELLRTDNFRFQSPVRYLCFSVLFIASFAFLWIGELWNVNIGIRMFVFFGVMAHNIFQYYRRKAQLEPYYRVLNYSIRLLYQSGRVEKLKIEGIEGELEAIRNLRKEFAGFQKGSSIVTHKTEGNLIEIALDYIRMVMFPDVVKFNSMMKTLVEKREQMLELFLNTGYLDSMYAIASYRKAYEGRICKPEFLSTQKKIYSVKGIYHPLIEEPVTNDFMVERSVLFTGSNASGKSTFLKTLGINTILAQSIHTVHAAVYQAPMYWVFSSMALADNLLNGESYYIVEIKMLKRVLDHADGQAPILCFIDEVLRGTNTTERIAASFRILKSLAARNALCMAATHDGELTTMLKQCYDNYHFEESILSAEQSPDGLLHVEFDYKCKEGPAVTRNAILLLESFGYPKDLTGQIRETVRQFEATGQWN